MKPDKNNRMQDNLPTILTDVNNEGVLTITIEGRLDSTTTGSVWRKTVEALDQKSPSKVVVNASKIDYCNGSGISLLVELQRRQKKVGKELDIRNLRPEFKQSLDIFDPDEFNETGVKKARKTNLAEETGRAIVKVWKDIYAIIAFVGELCVALANAALHPGRVRWKDAFLIAETGGVNAFPIIVLISFLIGLIMAFQAAIPMRQFGAEIFVADLIALSMLRELGPLMTGIILAGRTSSAFAAELGTMKVNEEIDALTTMGLDPVRFLVTTRVIATLVMTPLLTIFSNLLGVLGGAVVLMSLGYPFVTYLNQVISAADYVDLLGGILKSIVFAMIIAGIGCMRGLNTKSGASAVGDSTTRAVVSGIILIIVTDGVFSVVYFYLGI